MFWHGAHFFLHSRLHKKAGMHLLELVAGTERARLLDINGRIYQEQVHFQHMHTARASIHADHTEQICCCAPCHCTSIIVYSGSTVLCREGR